MRPAIRAGILPVIVSFLVSIMAHAQDAAGPDGKTATTPSAKVKSDAEIKAEAAAKARKPDFVNSLEMPFVLIPAGKFIMGTPPGEWGRFDNEGPQREVTITHPFYMCQYETVTKWFLKFYEETKYDPKAKNESGDGFRVVTPALKEVYVKQGKAPNRADLRELYPVGNMSWFAAIRFCNWLSEKEGRKPVYVFDEKETEGEFTIPVVRMVAPYDGGYRLPTEAEWEYAARAGTKTAFFFGEDDTHLKEYGHEDLFYYGPHEYRTMPPPKLPNPWGLYHMCGNANEWCWDRYGPSYEFYETVDPLGPARGEYRVVRDGGGFGLAGIVPAYSRSGTRLPEIPTMARPGFRVIFNPVKK